MLLELPRTLHPLAIGFLLGAHLVEAIKGFAVQFGKFRLRVERIDMRDPARHEAENDVLHFGREVRLWCGQIRVGLVGHERRKRHQSEAVGGMPEASRREGGSAHNRAFRFERVVDS